MSYQRGDQRWAHLLAERMAAYGGALWWDEGIAPGADWRESIIAALEKAPVMVLLHSAAAEKSAEVQKELAVASAQRKTIIAVRLEDRMPSGRFLYEMAALNWVEAFGDTEAALDRLAMRLAALKPGLSRDGVARDVDAAPIRAGRWHRWTRSLPRLAGIWLVALAAALAAQNALGEGIAAARTELGLPLGDMLREVAAVVIGAPLVVLRFLLSPPGNGAGWLFMLATLVMTGCYVLLGRTLWTRGNQWRARWSAERTG